MVNESVVYSAPGKIILFGEHAVVYGKPAIVAAIDRRASCKVTDSPTQKIHLSSSIWNTKFVYRENISKFVEKEGKSRVNINQSYSFIVETLLNNSSSSKIPEIYLDSNIPLTAGLGSSAAISVSMIASLADFLELKLSSKQINDLAFKAETITHGNPSGVDNTISTYGGILLFEDKSYKQIPTSMKSFQVVVANTNVSRNTKELVEKVAIFKKTNSQKFNDIIDNIKAITQEAVTKLMNQEYSKVGELMSSNHLLLEKLGVSHSSIEDLRKIFLKTDSLGSKLTGAGGGGCVIGLYDDLKNAKKAVTTIENKGYNAFISKFSEEGVLCEN